MSQHKIQTIADTPSRLFRWVISVAKSCLILHQTIYSITPSCVEDLIVSGKIVLTVWCWHFSFTFWLAESPILMFCTVTRSKNRIIIKGPRIYRIEYLMRLFHDASLNLVKQSFADEHCDSVVGSVTLPRR